MTELENAEDVVYLRDGDAELYARIRRPSGPGPFPAVLHVHGGVWNKGSRLSDEAICRHLAAHGIVVVSIDFRQAPQTRYPQSIADVHYGVRWLRANAERLGSSPDRVGGLGVSSGGHQLLLATMRSDDPRYARHDLPGTATLGYAVYLWPVTDPVARYRYAQRSGRHHLVRLHDAYWAGVAEMAEGSPQRHLESRTAGSVFPAVLLVYGDRDENIPEEITSRFVAAYRAAGGRLDVARYPGMPHGFIDGSPETAATHALDRIVTFIKGGNI